MPTTLASLPNVPTTPDIFAFLARHGEDYNRIRTQEQILSPGTETCPELSVGPLTSAKGVVLFLGNNLQRATSIWAL